MRINHFNSYVRGGAGTAARRLHESLLISGVDSHFHYSAGQQDPATLGTSYHAVDWNRGGLVDRIVSAFRYRRHRQEFKRGLRDRSGGHEIFTSPHGAPFTPYPPRYRDNHPPSSMSDEAEIIQLHWISKFIDYTSFFGSLSGTNPVVWTLHDMNAFTGGCHFSGGCQAFVHGCGQCPQLRHSSEDDLSRQALKTKQEAISDINLHVVAPSLWLVEAAKSSLIFRTAKSFTRIPYGIDTELYYPMDRGEARARLGIAEDAKVICFGAMDVRNRRKGSKEIVQALEAVADLPGATALVFGNGELPPSDKPLPAIHSVGLIQGTHQQRTVFSAADVFALPSLEDNLPLTGLEALACGTPIVGFRSGGIPDYVREGVSGTLASTGNGKELGQRLRELLSDSAQCRSLGEQARQMVLNEYKKQDESNAYQQLYAALLGQSDRLSSAAA